MAHPFPFFVQHHPDDTGCAQEKQADSHLYTNHHIAEHVPTGSHHHHTDDAGATQLPHRPKDDEHTYRKHYQIHLQRSDVDVRQIQVIAHLFRNIIYKEGIGKFADAHRQEQRHRHHAEAFGKEETEGAPCTRPHTLADGQLALTVVEHLDDELQEVHNARNQDQGGNEVAHRLYPNVSFVTAQCRVGFQCRILISRVELDLLQTFVQPMDIHTRLQYRFYIQCLSIECRQRKIDVRILQIPVDGKESIHYTHDAVKLDFPFLSRNPMQGHSQWVFLAECPTGKVTADDHFVLFQHTGITAYALQGKIGERTPIGLFVMGHIRHLTSVAVDDSYFRL